MTTAKAIEKITDAGAFEVLATRVLRQIDTDYARIEHLGVNADGKTVKNPLDGFSRVPGSNPSRYVMAAFSTDATTKIERKLLFDHTELSKGNKYKDADDGDLVKAARKADLIRLQDEDAEFIFTFCTNKQPNAEVMQAGYAAGKTVGIEVRFLARSGIRDHLDTTREGQWLRKEHLGIAADILSIPLLRELAVESVKNYSYELFCSGMDIVETATTRRVATLSTQNRPSVNVLIGASGSGKSVASYKALLDVIRKDGIALWLPAEVTLNSMSLDMAITTTLQSLCPTLGVETGRDSVTLTSNQKVPFLIVVDDVNRTANATQAIQKLITWHRQMASGEVVKDSTKQNCRVPHLIIPVWNHYWSSIASRYRSEGMVGEITAQMMTFDEAIDCLRTCSNQRLGKQKASDVVKRLEYDPILIGLWGELYGDKLANQVDADASGLIEAYIKRSIEEDSANSDLLAADIRTALEKLASKMLEERELYPMWSHVNEWLSTLHVAAVRRLCVSGKVCRVVHRNNVDRFEFRHDRLLETALTKPLKACLVDIENHRDIASDPFFTDSVARAIMASDDSVGLVLNLRDCAPLAVLRALGHITELDTTLAKTAVATTKEWLIEAATNKTTPPEIVFSASRILESIQSPLVLQVTDDIKDKRLFSGARLVNGDAVSGKFFVASQNFFPCSRAPFIEDLITRACLLHHERLCEDLAFELNNGCQLESELHAALILAGYFGESSLAEPVLKAWMREKKNRCLVEALWASIRCSTKPEVTLSPILDFWATLSDEVNEYGISERTQFLTEMEFCMRHGVNELVIKFLAYRAEHDDRLRFCITEILKNIDHPVATNFVATRIAHIEKEIEGTDKWSPWISHCREGWDPLRRPENRLSKTSRNAILCLWRKSDEKVIKKSLIKTWIATTDEVEELSSLPNEIATSRPVLWRRACLGDMSIPDLVLECIEDESVWWQVIPSIWTNYFIGPLDRALAALGDETPADFSGGTNNEHYLLSEVLRDIPVEVAEKQLLKHWESLKFSARFVQAALYVSGESLMSVAKAVIKDSPDDWEPFKHIGSMFGFKTIGLQDRLADRHIDALLPYVSQISDMDLMEIAEWLLDHGREKDFRMFLLLEINRRIEEQRLEGENSYIIRTSRLYFPTDEDLLDQLSEIENDERTNVWIWCRYATERGDSPERVRKVLHKWFLKEPSPRRLQIISKIILELGNREDIKELEKYQTKYGDDSTKILVDGAIFWVRYRTLS
jgi:hypothetical protein